MKILLLLTLFVGFTCFASISQIQYQTNLISCNDGIQTNPNDWVSYIDNQEFKIEYRFIDCDPEVGFDHEAVILKLENKTSAILDFDWQIHIYRNNDCKTCAHPIEYARTIQLAPNEVIEGTCDRNTNKQLKVFSRFIDSNYSKGLPLTGFQLHSLNTTIVE